MHLFVLKLFQESRPKTADDWLRSFALAWNQLI
jgi:hypothetical protein